MDHNKADPEVLSPLPTMPTLQNQTSTEVGAEDLQVGFSDSSSLATILRKLSTEIVCSGSNRP